jgi:hypothetical protein
MARVLAGAAAKGSRRRVAMPAPDRTPTLKTKSLNADMTTGSRFERGQLPRQRDLCGGRRMKVLRWFARETFDTQDEVRGLSVERVERTRAASAGMGAMA